MADDPAFFTHQAYLQVAGKPTYVVKRPSDLLDFIAAECLSGDATQYQKLDPVLESLGLTEKAPSGKYVLADRLSPCAKSIGLAVGLALVTNPEAKKAFLEAIRSSGQP
jgi:hypothetical protein